MLVSHGRFLIQDCLAPFKISKETRIGFICRGGVKQSDQWHDRLHQSLSRPRDMGLMIRIWIICMYFTGNSLRPGFGRLTKGDQKCPQQDIY